MISDPYKVLGVSPAASDEEITQAYRRMAKRYHPDLNHGDAEAAKKMSEVNAAYEQIKSGNTSRNGSAGNGSYGGGNYGGGYGNSGKGEASGDHGPFGFGSNPFGGFDPFGDFGPFGGSRQQQRRTSEFDPVESYLRAGYYEDALNVLKNITDRSAQWYYYSALANSGAGNTITALNHAKTAVQMEPDNAEYRRVLEQIQNGGRAYQQQSQGFGMPAGNMNGICLGLFLSNLCCMLCNRPCL